MKETFLKTVMEGAGIGRKKAEYLWQIGVRLPAEQHQGEPVACASIYVEQLYGQLVATVRRFDARMLPIGCLVNVYKYPADPGEVERLTRKCQNADLALKVQTQNCDSLRKQNARLLINISEMNDEAKLREAQLAERDALLARVVNSGALSSEQHEELEGDCCAAVDVVHQIKRQAFREHLDKCATLSASAEPSAPKFGVLAGEPEIIGERCKDGGVCHHECKQTCFRRLNCGALTGSGLNPDWSDPTAPVERDERANFADWCSAIGYTLKPSESGNGFKPGYGSELFSAWQARAALEGKA